jgi:tetratricopeptide (TPR) repeat protein
MLTGGARQAMLEKAHRLLAAGAFEQAAEASRQAVKQNPTDGAALRLLAASQAALGDFAGARATIERALKARPADVELLADVARTYLNQGRLAEAARGADRALRLAPASTAVVGLKAHIMVLAGDPQGAWAAMRALVESGGADMQIAGPLARVAARIGEQARAAALLERCIADPATPAPMRADLMFRLGDLRDAEGDHDRAFAAYLEANRARRAMYPYDARSTVAAVDELIARWAPGIVLPRASVKGDRALFIVGMPRSGTSLVEQVLASHSAVFAGGELDDIAKVAHQWQGTFAGHVAVFTRLGELTGAMLDAAGRAYLQRLGRLDARAARVTDKLPVNFLHLGLVSLMLPGARAVHCTRDAMDTCLSCFVQNFSGAIPFAYDLRDLGLVYGAYRRLMAHWDRVLEMPLLTAPYEEMVRDQEGTSRRLVKFAGLDWDDRCLKFYESGRVVMTASNDQVRQPVYTSSIGRWRRYERHLGPLIEALGQASP